MIKPSEMASELFSGENGQEARRPQRMTASYDYEGRRPDLMAMPQEAVVDMLLSLSEDLLTPDEFERMLSKNTLQQPQAAAAPADPAQGGMNVPV